MEENNSPQKQNPQNLIESALQTLRDRYIVVGARQIPLWKAGLFVGLIAGVAIGITLVANKSGEVEKGRAASSVGVITVISPNGGEVWRMGEQHTIQWQYSNSVPANLGVHLYAGSKFLQGIVAIGSPPFTWDWRIPINGLCPSSDYKVRVVDLADPSNFDDSDSAFSILAGTTTYPVALLGPHAFVIESDGTFFNAKGDLDAFALLRRFYQTIPDNYDFVAIITAIRGFRGGDSQFALKNDVEGIGLPLFDRACLFGLPTKRLLGFTTTNDIDKYIDQYPNVEPLLFEFYHQWVLYLGDQWDCAATNTCSTGLNINRMSHWSSLIDTSTKTFLRTYTDPAGGSIWQENEDGTFTYLGTGRAMNANTARFSDLSLYLMGLISPTEAKPLVQFVPSVPVPQNFSVNDIGKRFPGTKRLLTVTDLVTLGGIRNPPVLSSPKRFSVAFVLALDIGQVATNAEVKKLVSFSKTFPYAWNKATRGLSTINDNP